MRLRIEKKLCQLGARIGKKVTDTTFAIIAGNPITEYLINKRSDTTYRFIAILPIKDFNRLAKRWEKHKNGLITIESQIVPDKTPQNPGRYMLIRVTERVITTAFFSLYEDAYARMEQELYETMDGDLEAYKLDSDYGFYDNCAWSDADNNALSDWMIVEIPANM